MTHTRRASGPYVSPIRQSDNVKLTDEQGRGAFVLASGTLYFYILDGIDTPLNAVHVQWDAAAILTIAVEDTNFHESEADHVSIVKGEWIHEDPSTAYISVKSTDNTTGGGTVTNGTVAVAGGTAGGCMIHVGNGGARRMRLRIDVGGTGGLVRVGANQKD